MDESGDLFSDDALARVVASQHQLDAAGIRERVVRDVKRFVGDAEPHDDMTMIVLRVDDLGEASA
jgi:serine phosphatase RsbU (regulator of sigma subunit)